MKIISRKDEVGVLKEMLTSKVPEFLALYGRRRVGKTFLIRQFFANKKVVFFNVTGSKNGTMREQIINFTQCIAEIFYGKIELSEGKNWHESFSKLIQAMDQQVPKNKVTIQCL